MSMKKTKILVEKDLITFTIIHIPIKIKKVKRKQKDEEGVSHIYFEEIEVKCKPMYLPHMSLVAGISSVDSYINDRNQLVKSKCVAFDRFNGRDYLVNNSPEELKEALLTKTSKIGF